MNTKRIIPSFLLAALTSSSLLLAQAQNRLEVRGDRLEETENQSAGSRSSQEVKGDCSDIVLSTITARQYCDFLNAVAATNDSHDLYNSEGEGNLVPIICSQISGGYHYSIISGKEEEPISNISLLDGMRYCNWLENAQSVGEQGAEDGVYTLKSNKVIAINPNATHYLVNSGESQDNDLVTISSLSNLPSSTDLLQKSPDRGLCIASTTAPQLMMNPATGEELVGGLKRLGLTAQEGRVASSVRGSSSSVVVEAARVGNSATSAIKPELLTKAMVGRNDSDLKERYKKADELWSQKQKAREEKFKTQRKVEAAAEEYQKAEEVLAAAKTEHAAKDLEKTWLGRASRYAAKAATPLSYIPTPGIPLGGIASFFSGVANLANQVWAKKDVTAAKQSLKRIAKEKEKAEVVAKKAKDTFSAIVQNVPITERSAQHSDAEAAIITAKNLKSFADVKEVAHEAIFAWRERMNHSHQNIQTAEKQKNLIVQSLEKARRQAAVCDEACQDKLRSAEEELQAAIAIKTELEAKMESLDKELNNLEKQQAERGRYKEEVADLIKIKEKEFFAIYHKEHPETCERLKTAEDKKAMAITYANEANTELKSTRESRDAAEELHLGKIERAQAHFEADKIAGKDVFGITFNPLEIETNREPDVIATQKTVETPLVSDNLEFQKAQQAQQTAEMKAKQQEKDAIDAKEQAINFFGVQGESPELTLTKATQLWDEAIQKTRGLEAAWSQAAIYFQASYDQAPVRLQNWWMTHLTSAKNSNAEAAALVLWLEASKIESIAEAAKSEAEITKTTTEEGIESLWNKALEKRAQTEVAWNQVATAQREGYAQAPEQSKASWLENIEESENKKNTWAVQASLYEAQKAENLAKIIRSKAVDSKSLDYSEVVSLWDKVVHKLEESSKFLNQAAKEQKAASDLAPERLKDLWSNSIRSVEDQQLRLAATKLSCQAQKASSIVRVAVVLQKEAVKKDNSMEVYFWQMVCNKSTQASECWKTAQTLLSTDPKIADRWENVAEQLVASAEKYRKAAEALNLADRPQDQYLAKEAYLANETSSSSLWDLKSEEALGKANAEKENRNIAELWEKIAGQYKVIFNYEKQVAQAHMTGKKDEGFALDWAGYYTQISAETMIKASEAREAGQTVLAADYGKVAAKLGQAVELRVQEAQAYAAGKKDEGFALNWAGNYTQISAETMMKASEARDARKVDFAAEYEKSALKSDQAAELMKQAVQAHIAGKKDEGVQLGKAGPCIQLSAETMIKASDAREAGKTILAAEYEKAIIKSDQAAELMKQAAQAHAAGKKNEGLSLDWAGYYTRLSAETMVKASEAREAGKIILAAEYEKAAIKQDQAAGFKKQAAQTYVAGKQAEGIALDFAGTCTQLSAETMIKASEAREAKKMDLAIGYEEAATKLDKAAELMKQAVELKEQAAQAYAIGKEDEGALLDRAATYTQSSAETMIKVSEACEAGKIALAVEYERIAVKSAQAAELMKQAARSSAVGKEEEVTQLFDSGRLAQKEAEMMIQAIEAHEAGNIALAEEYEEEVAKLSQAQQATPTPSVPSFVPPVPVQQPVVSKFVAPVPSFVPGVPVQQPVANKFVPPVLGQQPVGSKFVAPGFIPPVPPASSFIPGVPIQQPMPVFSAPSFVPPVPVQQPVVSKFVPPVPPVSSFVPGVSMQPPNFAPSFTPGIPMQQSNFAPSFVPGLPAQQLMPAPSFIPGVAAQQPNLAPSFFPGAGNSVQTPNQGKK